MTDHQSTPAAPPPPVNDHYEIAMLVADGHEPEARERYGDEQVDAWFAESDDVNARDRRETDVPWLIGIGYHEAQFVIYANNASDAEHLGAVTLAIHAGAANVQTYLSADEARRLSGRLLSAAADADKRRQVTS